MNREDIIQMAREAGLDPDLWNYTDAFERFAVLVASAEREACAKVCEQHGYEHYCGNVTDKLAETIRARGKP